MEGIIVQGRGGLYTVLDDSGEEYVLRAKKKFRRLGTSPLVGDRILFTPGQISDEHGWIDEILPRSSQCLRPPVANVTLIVLVAAPQPEPDWSLVDKLLIYARRQQVKALLVINKEDTEENEATYEKACRVYEKAELEVFSVSARENKGLDTLKKRLQGEVCCFSGQSGVGKSTLLNALFDLKLETGDISQKIRRGKNTTRHAELFRFGSICVIDTPGFSLMELEERFAPVLLKDYYPEFLPYEGMCRFSPCYHDSEPGCAVLKAQREGALNSERMERYRELLHECREAWRNRYD